MIYEQEKNTYETQQQINTVCYAMLLSRHYVQLQVSQQLQNYK